MVAQSSLVGQVKACQNEDPHLANLRDQVPNGGVKSFPIDGEGVLHQHGRLYIPIVDDVKQLILEEPHSSRYSIHPGTAKMYQDLRGWYWWKGMKADTLKYVTDTAKQLANIYLYLSEILEYMLRACAIGFGGYWDVSCRWCRSPVGLFEHGEAQLLGPDLFQQALEKVALI
ncbi:uncharacterized protein LOC132628559 [Lycium barbarum]|uniref:uncharacterized protein LOC132628559 n=1 Tax=Lycium barbarum TaxID=112863 RepID=UPI00293F230D|nr:uncharacterized protein LOC132628559 [Lycium barbarum]